MTRRHVFDPNRGAISVSLAVVLGLVGVGLVVAVLGIALGFAAGGDDASAVQQRVARLQEKVDAANAERRDSTNAVESDATKATEIWKIATALVASEAAIVELDKQMVAVGDDPDTTTYNQLYDQESALFDQDRTLNDQLDAVLAAE